MGRAEVITEAVRPTARVSHLGSVGATVGFGALPLVVTVARGGTDLTVALVLLALAAGASIGWAVDDEAQDTLAALPVPSPVRVLVRIGAAVAAASSLSAVALLVAGAGPGLPSDVGARVPEALAAAAIASAVALSSARAGERSAAIGGVVAGVVVPGVVAAFAVRWPSVFPTFMRGPVHGRWWWVFGVAVMVAVHAGRDGARR